MVTAGVAGSRRRRDVDGRGEYISVSSQRDAEDADREIEAEALAQNRTASCTSWRRSTSTGASNRDSRALVAEQLMAQDELGAHMRDELGITEIALARPFQAAATSAVSFIAGALPPLLAVTFVPGRRV